jgi:hypothetical protein
MGGILAGDRPGSRRISLAARDFRRSMGVCPDSRMCRLVLNINPNQNSQWKPEAGLMTTRSISIRTLDDRDGFRDDDEHALRLRHRILKLRWIGYETEAATLVARLRKSGAD